VPTAREEGSGQFCKPAIELVDSREWPRQLRTVLLDKVHAFHRHCLSTMDNNFYKIHIPSRWKRWHLEHFLAPFCLPLLPLAVVGNCWESLLLCLDSVLLGFSATSVVPCTVCPLFSIGKCCAKSTSLGRYATKCCSAAFLPFHGLDGGLPSV
jgi:hypothetical protein